MASRQRKASNPFRWTDNIYSLHSWIGRKFPSISVSDLNKQFGIPEDLDYVSC